MNSLIESLTTKDATSVLPLAALLQAVRERLPGVRRDELLVHLAQSGYALICTSEATFVSGIKMA